VKGANIMGIREEMHAQKDFLRDIVEKQKLINWSHEDMVKRFPKLDDFNAYTSKISSAINGELRHSTSVITENLRSEGQKILDKFDVARRIHPEWLARGAANDRKKAKEREEFDRLEAEGKCGVCKKKLRGFKKKCWKSYGWHNKYRNRQKGLCEICGVALEGRDWCPKNSRHKQYKPRY